MRGIWLASFSVLLATAPLAVAGPQQAFSDYVLHCSGCHGMGGLGTTKGGIPPFPNSVGKIASIDAGRTYIMHVPGVVGNNLTDAEIAGVMNFVLDRWGEGGEPFSAEEVTRRRSAPVADVVAFRRVVVQELAEAGIEVADYPWP